MSLRNLFQFSRLIYIKVFDFPIILFNIWYVSSSTITKLAFNRVEIRFKIFIFDRNRKSFFRWPNFFLFFHTHSHVSELFFWINFKAEIFLNRIRTIEKILNLSFRGLLECGGIFLKRWHRYHIILKWVKFLQKLLIKIILIRILNRLIPRNVD